MIKKSMLFLALISIPHAYGYMYFDVRTKMCKTYPESDKIDQELYNELAADLYWDLLDLWKNYNYNIDAMWRLACVNIKKKAEAINTPTSRRFIEDLDMIPNIHAYNSMIGLR